jgi:outer membrane usher protein
MRAIPLLALCGLLSTGVQVPAARAAQNFPGAQAIGAPLLLDAENFGDVWVYPHAKPERFEIESEGLLRALERALESEYLEQFRPLLVRAPKISLGALREAGLSLRFDEAALVMRLEPSDDQRARKMLRVRRGADRDERETVGPAGFSGYLNATVAESFVYPQRSVRQPFRTSLGLVSNFHGVVLETGASYEERSLFPWRRDDTRLSRDFEGSLLRLTLGDIPVQAVGYQGSRPLGGIALTRQYSIQPYLNTRPLSRTEIQLPRPATIEVYVNDGFVNRLNAPAGPLRLADFPLFNGVNKVDLKITDDAGRIEWVNLNLLYDVQLLGQGIQEFAYQLGAPSTNLAGDRRYDEENITFSFFHRVGVTDRLTVGAALQGDRYLQLGSAEFAYLTRVGLFSAEGGISQRDVAPTATAFRGRFKSLDYKRGNDKPWRGTLEAEYRARLFSSLGQAGGASLGGLFAGPGVGENPYSWRFDATVSRPLTALTTVSLGARYEVNRLLGADRRSARLDVNTEVGPRLRAAVTYAAEREARFSQSLQLLLTWVDEGGKYYGNFGYDYPSRSFRAEVTRNSANIVDDFRGTLGAQTSSRLSQVDGFLDYTHEKANLRLEHASTRTSETGAEGRRLTNRTGFAASTAVAWAGGAVAWTRPISDSFAIVRARPLFRKFDLPVNRIDTRSEARVNRAGPAVIPTITAYNPTPVNVDSSGLPMGYSLGREFYLARPTYRSGVLIEVGGESSVILSGTLLREDGRPVALQVGAVVPVVGVGVGAGAGPGATEFFTNGEGGFVLENLAPGAYEIRVDGFRPVQLSVPAGAVGFQKFKPYRIKEE